MKVLFVTKLKCNKGLIIQIESLRTKLIVTTNHYNIIILLVV